MTAKTKQILSLSAPADLRPSNSVGMRVGAPAPPPLINFNFPRKVALFTPIRPKEYVERVAAIFLEYDQPKSERLIEAEMEVIADKLLAFGADPAEVDREIRKIESSIRTAMWHLVMGTKPL